MSSQLARLNLIVGDEVKFKKPRRNPKKGIVRSIVTDPDAVQWSGMSPRNVEVEILHEADGITYGMERVFVNMKKVIKIF